jgi:hypothetical protein
MPANGAVSAPDQAKLVSRQHQLDVELSYVPDTVVGTATVATTPTPDFTTGAIVDIAVSGADAGWINSGRTDRTVKITAPSGTLRGYYRMRKAQTSTHIYPAEIRGLADGGLFTQAMRSGGITAGDTCTILDRYDPDDRKPFNSYPDYDMVLGSLNAKPEGIVNLTINGQPGHYRTKVSSGNVTLTVKAFVTRWPPSSGSTLTYLWDIPSAATNVSGLLTDTLTMDLPSGAAYWVRLIVADSIGNPTEAARAIILHNPSYPPLSIRVPINMNGDRTGWRVPITGVQTALAQIPYGALCIVGGAQDWNGGDIVSAAHSKAGFFLKRPVQSEPGYFQAVSEIVGPGHVLSMIEGYALALNYTGTTLTWDELGSDISTLQFVLWWILARRTANFLRLFNFTPFSLSNLENRRKQFATNAANVLQQLQQLAGKKEVNIGSRSDGEIICVKHPSMDALKGSLTPRISLDATMWQNIQVEWQHKVDAKPVHWEGYSSDLVNETLLLSEAPGQATDASKVTEKIFESQTDANQRSGYAYAMAKNEFPKMHIALPGNWDIFEPVDMQPVNVGIPADKSPTGGGLSLICIPDKVSKTVDGRRAAVVLDGESETDGLPGITIYPQPQVIQPNTYNSPPKISTVKSGFGSPSNFVPSRVLALCTNGQVHRAGNIMSSPSITQITPSDSPTNGRMMITDPWTYGTLIASWDTTIRELPNFLTAPAYPAASWTTRYTTPGGWFINGGISGSINRKDFFCWFESAFNAYYGSDRFCYTTDRWSTVHYTTGIGASSGDAWQGLSVGCFNTASSGTIVIAAGAELKISHTWGASFSSIPGTGFYYDGGAGTPLGGGCNMPYSKPGGGENRDMSYITYGRGNAASVNRVDIVDQAGVLIHDMAGERTGHRWYGGPQSINTFTLDSNRQYFFTEADLWRTDDGGATLQATQIVAVGSICISGWATNKDWLVGDGGAVTLDAGATYIDLHLGLPAITTIFADLQEVYNEAVHPSV